MLLERMLQLFRSKTVKLTDTFPMTVQTISPPHTLDSRLAPCTLTSTNCVLNKWHRVSISIFCLF